MSRINLEHQNVKVTFETYGSTIQEHLIKTYYVNDAFFRKLALNELHVAALKGWEGHVKDLLKQKPHLLHKRDEAGSTPLHWAAYSGNENIVNMLIAAMDKREIEASDGSQSTALMVAVSMGHKTIVNTLLDNMSLESITKVSEVGNNVLHRAVINGHENIAATLIKKAPQMINVFNEFKASPLLWAIKNKDEHMIDLLLSNIKNKDTVRALGPKLQDVLDDILSNKNIMEMFLEKAPELIDIKFKCGTILCKAVIRGYADTAKMLLEKKPELANITDKDGDGPLNFAVLKRSIYMIELLLEYTSDKTLNSKDINGNTLLHHAAQDSDIDVVKLLLECVNDDTINARNNEGAPALYLAILGGNVDIVNLLLAKMPPKTVTIIDNNGYKAEHYVLSGMREYENEHDISKLKEAGDRYMKIADIIKSARAKFKELNIKAQEDVAAVVIEEHKGDYSASKDETSETTVVHLPEDVPSLGDSLDQV